MIRTRPSFHQSIYLNQHTLNLWDKLIVKAITEYVEKTLDFLSKWRIIDNMNIISLKVQNEQFSEEKKF